MIYNYETHFDFSLVDCLLGFSFSFKDCYAFCKWKVKPHSTDCNCNFPLSKLIFNHSYLTPTDFMTLHTTIWCPKLSSIFRELNAILAKPNSRPFILRITYCVN